MKSKVVLRSPLGDKTPGGPLRMREIAGLASVVVRGDIADEKFAAGFQNAVGVAPPDSHRAATVKGKRIVFRLGPDEWLVRDSGGESARESLVAGLTRELAETHSAVADVSDYYTVVQIAGGGARDALAAGCPLDLHPQAFAAKEHAQSRFGTAAILLYRRDDEPTFDVQVRWSFAAYLWEYLRAAGDA